MASEEVHQAAQVAAAGVQQSERTCTRAPVETRALEWVSVLMGAALMSLVDKLDSPSAESSRKRVPETEQP